jgi:hypothetical protein
MKSLALITIFCIGMAANAQKDNVGIGTAKPDQSALLDLNSSTKGLLMPRMSLQQRNLIQSPANGLMIYQTDFLSGFYFFDGNAWKPVVSETNANSVADAINWGLTGNVGTNPTSNFVGPGDGANLRVRSSGYNAGYLDGTNKHATWGTHAGAAFINTAASTIVQENVAIGHYALSSNNAVSGYTGVGGNNVAIGSLSQYQSTSGSQNVSIGSIALRDVLSGNRNMAIGSSSLAGLTTGNENIAIGIATLSGNNGSNNTAIGFQAGFSATGTASNNLFLGNQAGFSETGSNKLYLSNSNTALPLVYGDFSAKFISIGDVGVAGDAVATAAKRNNLATQYGLLVQKGILTEKIKVATLTSTDWADYVFENDYKRMTLEEVETFVKENKHLPNVPTTNEMMSTGSDLIKTDAKLLEKIEELTLYMIEMNKEIKTLKKENEVLKNVIKNK